MESNIEFTGTVRYTTRPDGTPPTQARLHFRSLKIADDSISFKAESESEEYGLWELRGKADENSEGEYVTKKCRWEQDCEPGDLATLTIHRIDISADNCTCAIVGRIEDNDGVWPFGGSLTSVKNHADKDRPKKEDVARAEVVAVEVKRELPTVEKSIAPQQQSLVSERDEALAEQASSATSPKPIEGIGVFKVLFWIALGYWLMKGASTLPGILEAGIGFKSLLKIGLGVILPIYLSAQHKSIYAWWEKTKIEMEEEAKEKERLAKIKRQQQEEEAKEKDRLNKIKRQEEQEEKVYLCLRLLYEFCALDVEDDQRDGEIIRQYLLSISHEEEIQTVTRNNAEKLNVDNFYEDDLDTLLSKFKLLLSKNELVKFIETCKEIIHADGEVNDAERTLFGHVRTTLLRKKSSGDWICPNCNSDNSTKISEEETDRWRARKSVEELSARGAVMIKNVSVTKVKIESHWQCDDCEDEWTTTEEEEKT